MLWKSPHYHCPEYDMLCRPTPLPAPMSRHDNTRTTILPDIPWSTIDIPKDEWLRRLHDVP